MTHSVLNDYVKRAESSLRTQRKRSLIFSDNLIFDSLPWELLLEIYIATERNSCISKQKLDGILNAPSSIVLRWINIFEDRQYLESCEIHSRDCVRLTDKARTKCCAYLDSIIEDQL